MKFFRDVLDGPLYIIVVVVAVILIMAIIGFILEKKKLAKEAQDKIATVDLPKNTGPVNVTNNKKPETIPVYEEMPKEEEKKVNTLGSLEVKTPVFVFEDPDEKK